MGRDYKSSDLVNISKSIQDLNSREESLELFWPNFEYDCVTITVKHEGDSN